jgi:hypothetical protein
MIRPFFEAKRELLENRDTATVDEYVHKKVFMGALDDAISCLELIEQPLGCYSINTCQDVTDCARVIKQVGSSLGR